MHDESYPAPGMGNVPNQALTCQEKTNAARVTVKCYSFSAVMRICLVINASAAAKSAAHDYNAAAAQQFASGHTAIVKTGHILTCNHGLSCRQSAVTLKKQRFTAGQLR